MKTKTSEEVVPNGPFCSWCDSCRTCNCSPCIIGVDLAITGAITQTNLSQNILVTPFA